MLTRLVPNIYKKSGSVKCGRNKNSLHHTPLRLKYTIIIAAKECKLIKYDDLFIISFQIFFHHIVVNNRSLGWRNKEDSEPEDYIILSVWMQLIKNIFTLASAESHKTQRANLQFIL